MNVRNGFRKLLDLFPHRIYEVDASKPLESVYQEVKSKVEQLIYK